MNFPDFITAWPALDIPFPAEVVETHAVQSDKGLVVFFRFLQDVHLPPHSHLGQWGTVIKGELKIAMNGETRVYGPGDSYDIPAGTVHEVWGKAGGLVLDAFEEPNRYPLRD